MKFQSLAAAALVGTLVLASCGDATSQSKLKTVAQVHQNKAALAGQTISATGTVVKANNGIKGYNFVHVQDGTGSEGSNRLIARSKQTATVGSKVTISGTVVVDKDMGGGYFYPLIIEEASITPAK